MTKKKRVSMSMALTVTYTVEVKGSKHDPDRRELGERRLSVTMAGKWFGYRDRQRLNNDHDID